MSGVEGNKEKSDLKQYIFVIRQLASKEIKRGNASKNLGQMWNILMPFISMITLAVIFSSVFHRNIQEYMPFAFTGTIIYGLYNGGMRGAMSALSGNKALLIRTKIPKQVFVIEKVYVAVIHMCFSLVGYVAILIITRTPVGPTVFLTPLGMIISLFIILGFGKILAVLNVYFADISYFYQVFMLLVFYASAIFFPMNRFSPAMQNIVEFNPVYLTIKFARSCILYNTVPEPMVWIKLIIYAIAAYIVGSLIFKKGSQDVVAKL